MKTLLQEIQKKWPKREKTFHKGDFGRLLILAGSKGMTGAAELSALAALRTGAGLVTLGIPEKVYPVLARKITPDGMTLPLPSTSDGSLAFRSLKPLLKKIQTQNVLAVGPGLSQNAETQKLIRTLIQKTKIPVVLDADGLNAFVNHSADLKHLQNRAILTPHPGEFTRLFGGKLTDQKETRKKSAQWIAEKYGFILVLKGYETIVAQPGKIYVNMTGNPGMAKGGFGDVLTGMIAALIAQGFSLWDSARFGVYLHGLAADQKVKQTGEVSLMASDLLSQLPQTIKKIRNG